MTGLTNLYLNKNTNTKPTAANNYEHKSNECGKCGRRGRNDLSSLWNKIENLVKSSSKNNYNFIFRKLKVNILFFLFNFCFNYLRCFNANVDDSYQLFHLFIQLLSTLHSSLNLPFLFLCNN